MLREERLRVPEPRLPVLRARREVWIRRSSLEVRLILSLRRRTLRMRRRRAAYAPRPCCVCAPPFCAFTNTVAQTLQTHRCVCGWVWRCACGWAGRSGWPAGRPGKGYYYYIMYSAVEAGATGGIQTATFESTWSKMPAKDSRPPVRAPSSAMWTADWREACMQRRQIQS